MLGRTWGLRGQTPEVPTSGKRQSVSAISAVNALGEFWFEIYSERLNATKFIDLLTNFMRRRKSPVFLVLDSHPAHIAKSVARYVQSLKGRLELHFLPGYAPELNPDEFVWNHLKRQGVSKKPLLKNESLRHRVHADLTDIQSRPGLVRSFFKAPPMLLKNSKCTHRNFLPTLIAVANCSHESSQVRLERSSWRAAQNRVSPHV